MCIFRFMEANYGFDDAPGYYVVIADTEDAARNFIKEKIKIFCQLQRDNKIRDNKVNVLNFEDHLALLMQNMYDNYVLEETSELAEGVIFGLDLF